MPCASGRTSAGLRAHGARRRQDARADALPRPALEWQALPVRIDTRGLRRCARASDARGLPHPRAEGRGIGRHVAGPRHLHHELLRCGRTDGTAPGQGRARTIDRRWRTCRIAVHRRHRTIPDRWHPSGATLWMPCCWSQATPSCSAAHPGCGITACLESSQGPLRRLWPWRDASTSRSASGMSDRWPAHRRAPSTVISWPKMRDMPRLHDAVPQRLPSRTPLPCGWLILTLLVALPTLPGAQRQTPADLVVLSAKVLTVDPSSRIAAARRGARRRVCCGRPGRGCRAADWTAHARDPRRWPHGGSWSHREPRACARRGRG